ncbi:MAG: hypothetical protein Q8R57_00385 [Bacteroidota bacterium]|nr:hypothetical protein [Bacteroidota bacterium]
MKTLKTIKILKFTAIGGLLVFQFLTSKNLELLSHSTLVSAFFASIVFGLYFYEKHILLSKLSASELEQINNSKSFLITNKPNKYVHMLSDIIGFATILWVITYFVPKYFGIIF